MSLSKPETVGDVEMSLNRQGTVGDVDKTEERIVSGTFILI